VANGDPWTGECDQELRQWSANGRSIKEMAELTGRTGDAISHRKALLGLRGGSATCRRCGAPVKKSPTRPANYCTTECAEWAHYEATVGHKPSVEVKGVCAHCEKPFARMVGPTGPQGPTAAAAYCSRDCDKAAWYLRQKTGPRGREFMRERSERSNARSKRLRAAARVQ
jgi:hypothetical protein